MDDKHGNVEKIGRSTSVFENRSAASSAAEEQCDWEEMNRSLRFINENYDIPYDWELGPKGLKTFVKRILRNLLRHLILPILEKQSSFNANTVCSLNNMRVCLEKDRVLLDTYRAALDLCSKELGTLRESSEKDRAALNLCCKKLESIRKAMTETYEELDYFKFQNTFRGSFQEIKERQKAYLPLFENATAPVLDIGCGRGEFLELMKENNIQAFGVDLYPQYQAMGKEKGLDIRHGDGIEFLKNSSDKFGGIFACQIVEHIKIDQIQSLCKEAYEKMEPGASLVMETPNPVSVAMFTTTFYIDPTHQKPIHPVLLRYMAESVGFSDVQIVFTEASCLPRLPLIQSNSIDNIGEINDAINRVSDMLCSSLDYAIIATK